MPTPTTTYSLSKPTVGGDDNAWGTEINNNLDKLDDLLDGTLSITPNLATGWEVGGVAVTASAAELNILDGVTASTAEINILDGVTASTAEINLLDGVTATTTELNYVDGVTSAIQTQLDGKQAADATLTSLSGLSLAAGDVLYATAADTVQRLAIGTAGQVLTVNSGATAPEWAAGASTVLLGTMTTTSGNTQTLSGLNLTGYKQVQVWLNGVSATTAATFSVGGIGITNIGSASGIASGLLTVDLATGVGIAIGSSAFDARASTITTASTSISITTSAGNFDAGSVRVYGVK